MHMISKILLVVLLLSSNFTFAANKVPQMNTAEMESQLYKTVVPMNKEDETSVIIFFKYSCPVCRNYHAIFDHWGSTLPKPFIFQFFPIIEGDGKQVISNDSGLGTLGFWSAEQSGKHEQRNMYSEEMYGLYQDRHIKITPNAVIDAAASSGISMALYEKAWKKELAGANLHVERQMHYKPEVTPTIIICGKYMFTPANALGNQDTLIQMMNGLLSKCMVEKGYSK